MIHKAVMNHRIIGLDLARVFSIFGMMVVNYHFGFGAFEGNKILLEIANFFSGRASATFVILAGMGLILFAKKLGPILTIRTWYQIRAEQYSFEVFYYLL